MTSLLRVHALRAGNGDAIHIRYPTAGGNSCNILIDGGNNLGEYRRYLKEVVSGIIARREHIDLLVATHQDQDHVKGIQWLLRDLRNPIYCRLGLSLIRRYWFNGPQLVAELLKLAASGVDVEHGAELSYAEAQALERAILHDIEAPQWDRQHLICEGTSIEIHGAHLTVLSPTRRSLSRLHESESDLARVPADHGCSLATLLAQEERAKASGLEDLDCSLSNASSIAFLLERRGKRVLILGDATPGIVDSSIDDLLRERGIARLNVDVTKLSHHGSKRSVSRRFLSLISCENFIVSTDGRRHGLPSKATVARILLGRSSAGRGITRFHFNSDEVVDSLGFSSEEQRMYRFEIRRPQTAAGCIIDL